MRKIFLIMFFIYMLCMYATKCPLLTEEFEFNTNVVKTHFQDKKLYNLKQGKIKLFVEANIHLWEIGLSDNIFIDNNKRLPYLDNIQVSVHKYGNIFRLIQILAYITMIIAIFSYVRNLSKKNDLSGKEFVIISLFSVISPMNFWICNMSEIPFISAIMLMVFVYAIFIIIYLILKLITRNTVFSIYCAIFLNWVLLYCKNILEIQYLIIVISLYLVACMMSSKLFKKFAIVTICALFITNFCNYSLNNIKIFKKHISKQLNYVNDMDYEPTIHRNRDIYIVLLDAYSGQDILKQKYDYSNQEFIDELNNLGFFVFDRMLSNYNLTFASLPSFLNYKYFEEINCSSSSDAISNAELFKIAKKNQYNIVFKSLPVFNIRKGLISHVIKTDKLNIKAIVHSYFFHALYNKSLELLLDKIYAKYENISFEVKAIDKNKNNLVFMHLFMPHYPYLYDENGNKIPPFKRYRFDGYLPYLKYANKNTLNFVKNLINTNVENPPVIIIIGDHGLRDLDINNSQHSTFAAYYNPEQNYENVKSSITLINFFINFTNYEFGTSISPKEDKIYFLKSPGEPNDNNIFQTVQNKRDWTDQYINEKDKI